MHNEIYRGLRDVKKGALAIFHLILFTALPLLSAVLGFFYPRPNQRAQNGIEHFAVGAILSAVTIELLPNLIEAKSHLFLGLGFLVGFFLFLAFKIILHKVQPIFIDFFMCGLVLGISFLVGKSHGMLISIGLIIEFIYLSMKANKFNKSIFLSPILIIIGTILGYLLITDSSLKTINFMTAFSISSLMYLVIGNLLKQVYTNEDRIWNVPLFLLGFLLIILIE